MGWGRRKEDSVPELKRLLVATGERLAVNLFDLDRMPERLRAAVAMRIDPKPIVLDGEAGLNGGPREVGLAFACPLMEAATLCDLLRQVDRDAGQRPVRLYICKKAWSPIPDDRVLTVPDPLTKRMVLNPDVFRVDPGSASVVAPIPRKVTFGK
jgi:hypothetical protein